MPRIAIPGLVTPAQATDQAPEAKQEPGDQKPSVIAQSDAEIMALLIALDGNEISAANVAMKKNVEGKALALAKAIEQDHTKNRNEANRLAGRIGMKPKATPASRDLLTRGKERSRSLSTQEGRAFEELFVSEVAKGHRDALLMLDGFLETAQNQDLKAHTNEVRQHVARHLQEAERLQGKAPDTVR